MSKQFGIPYMGSKSKICSSIAMNFPKAKNFYDLFGGGFSMTHYLMENKPNKYNHFYYNEINPLVTGLVKRAVNGDFNCAKFKPPWVSREEFHSRKMTDGYVACIWSFGNNKEYYLFAEAIEEYKRSMHMAIVFDEFNELAEKTLRFDKWPSIANTISKRRAYLRQILEHYRKTKIPKHLYRFLSEKQIRQLGEIPHLNQLERLQRLQQLEQLERLQELERLDDKTSCLTITTNDYIEVEILPDSVVYCDIPYQGTAEYQHEFDHKAFFDWASSCDFPVYISEYNIDDSRFKLVYEIDKLSLLDNSKNKKAVKSEKLYWNGK